MRIRSNVVPTFALIVCYTALVLRSQQLPVRRDDIGQTIAVRPCIEVDTASAAEFHTTGSSADEESSFDDYVEPTNHDDSGCGRSTEGTPLWVRYSKMDEVWLWSVQQCIARIDDSRFREYREMRSMNRDQHTKMLCSKQINEIEMLNILGRYRNITFFGDTTLHHQVLTLFCMLNSNLYNVPIEFEAIRVFRPPYYHYVLHQSKNRTTHIRYVPYATDWGPKVRSTFWTKLERAVHESTPRDAIIFNGGLHSVSTSIDLEKFRGYIDSTMDLTGRAACQVYYMETVHEEYPTSNGILTPSCRDDMERGLCECEVLSQDRLEGKGEATGLAKLDIGTLALPSEEMSQLLPYGYADRFQNQQKSCVPDCLPASWRNDFVRSRFEKKANPPQIVPIFYQLLAQGQLQSRASDDCNHKSSATLVEMMKQVLRVMDEDSKEWN